MAEHSVSVSLERSQIFIPLLHSVSGPLSLPHFSTSPWKKNTISQYIYCDARCTFCVIQILDICISLCENKCLCLISLQSGKMCLKAPAVSKMKGGMAEGTKEVEGFRGEQIPSFIALRNILTLKTYLLQLLRKINIRHLELQIVKEGRG